MRTLNYFNFYKWYIKNNPTLDSNDKPQLQNLINEYYKVKDKGDKENVKLKYGTLRGFIYAKSGGIHMIRDKELFDKIIDDILEFEQDIKEN